eukprot:TRINITY_DN13634_c0_g1_i1.p1 TRINITY_DN13634_c0_g1~~TRINITY_DN13634_c0_g1_i1.p1  ORF type:complete len:198 (+),score=34.64 TRINITY_DN13634_c0_g1_i1:137-730(+)
MSSFVADVRALWSMMHEAAGSDISAVPEKPFTTAAWLPVRKEVTAFIGVVSRKVNASNTSRQMRRRVDSIDSFVSVSTEKRCAPDGIYYTLPEFMDYYGGGFLQHWEEALATREEEEAHVPACGSAAAVSSPSGLVPCVEGQHSAPHTPEGLSETSDEDVYIVRDAGSLSGCDDESSSDNEVLVMCPVGVYAGGGCA